MGRGKTGRSRITKFAADFFAAEIRAWHGEEPSTVIATLYAVTVYESRMALRQALLLCFAAYTAWILVSLWRCANNTKEKL
jgi:dolichyl-phosphate-mannose--protein O-mannosyl transferase